MKRMGCIACGFQLPEEALMKLEGMPASAQDIPNQEELGEDHGITLELCQCSQCGLVQFDCEPVDYYREVIRSGGFSTTMVELRRRQFRHFIGTYGLEGKKIIEAGCGQGEFLSVLAEFPVKAYGIECSDALVALARSRGLTVWKQFTEWGVTVLKNPDGEGEGPYDAFVSFNFLEHQPDPTDMLRCLYKNLTEDGLGLLTVPSFEYILEHDGYYELIRDHIAYYTFDTLRFLLDQTGFTVLEEEVVNRDTLSVIVKKKKIARADISGLVKSREVIGSEIDGLLNRLEQEGKTLAVWGASHQGFTLASTTGLGKGAQYIIDSAPFKQGLYAPASHLPIVAPEWFLDHPVDVILIIAPGYTDEIAGNIREKFGAEVEILAIKSKHLERI